MAPAIRSRRASKSHPSSSDGKTQLTDFSQISAHASDGKTQLTDFSQISAYASGVWHHSHPWSHPQLGIFIVTSLNDTSTPRTREHLHPCLHLTNPCAKWKVLSLTKPKGKIYKMKSLGHYITYIYTYI